MQRGKTGGTRRKRKALLFVAPLLLLAQLLLPVLLIGDVSAASISYRWKDANTLTVSGAATGDLKVSSGSANSFLGKVSANGCNTMFVTLDPAKNSITLSNYSGPTAGESGSVPCYADKLEVSTNHVITNSRPGGANTENFKRAVVTFLAPTYNKPPSNITFTLSKDNKTVNTSSVPKDIITERFGSNTAVYLKEYSLDPGNYKICLSVNVPCKDFTKNAGQVADVRLGSSGDNSEVNVRVDTKLTAQAGAQITQKPLTLVLKSGNTNAYVVSTDEFKSSAPISGGQFEGSTAGARITISQYATFNSVKAGKYRVCQQNTDNCADVTKTDGNTGSPNPVVLGIEGSDTLGIGLDPSTAETLNDKNATCETGGFGLNWILCPVYNMIADFCDWMFEKLVEPLLRTSPISTDPNDISYKIWSNFRIYGNIFLIIALLVIVFGQSIGGGLVDAYTAKKVLPRLLAASIMINLSIYIVAFLVDMTNIIGGGLGRLMTAPLEGAGAFSISPSFVGAGEIIGATTIVGALGLIAVGLAGVPSMSFILLFILMPVVLGLLAAFIVLVLRKAIILALVLVSPVAFALYCLPNTEKYFKKWWELLLQTLMVYPIVIMFFAVADIMAVTVVNANNKNNGLALLISFVLQFLPLVFIPYAFKMAGGLVGRAYDVLNGSNKRIQEAVKGNVNDPNSLRNSVKRRQMEKITRGQARVVDAGRDINAGRLTKMRGRVSDRFGNVDARLSTYNATARELSNKMSQSGRDDLRYAGAGYVVAANQPAADGSVTGDKRFFDSKGRVISSNMYKRGKELYGTGSSNIQQGLEYTLRKAQSADDLRNFRYAYAQNAIAENWSDQEGMDVWAGSTFEHKDKWKSEWYSTPSMMKDANGKTQGVAFADVGTSDASYDKMINEVHRVPEQFKLSSLRAEDWQAMGARQESLQTKIATGAATQPELERFAKTSEVLDTMVSQGLVMQNNDGEVSVAGSSPVTQKVIGAIYKSRKYATAPVETTPGTFSTTDRAIYDVAAVKAATTTAPGSKDTAIKTNTVGVAKVTSDRSDIPLIV